MQPRPLLLPGRVTMTDMGNDSELGLKGEMYTTGWV